MHRTRSASLTLAVGVLMLSPAALTAREGFGFSKRSATLHCQTPPDIHLNAAKIDVRLAGQVPDQDSARILREMVEARLTRSDQRLKIETTRPDVIILLTAGPIEVQEAWEERPATELKQTGERDEWNSIKGRYEKKPVFSHVTVYKSMKVARGTMEARYEVIDPQDGQTIHQAAVRAGFEETHNSLERSEMERRLLEGAADAIATQLVGSVEDVSVLLPRGSFDSLVSLAERGLWQSYYEAVQHVSAKRRPADEAYRQYALGLAHEAMAYSSGNPERALQHLHSAEEHYARACQLKPGEKLFTQSAPFQRVKSGIANYERLRNSRKQSAVSSQ